jgi:hypothetical protein
MESVRIGLVLACQCTFKQEFVIEVTKSVTMCNFLSISREQKNHENDVFSAVGAGIL